jgi:exoribonuclease-2
MLQVEHPVSIGALVLYRGRAARVSRVGERLEIELGNETQRVRPKDIQLLHPGPYSGPTELIPLPGEMRAAWEILSGDSTTLAELSELAFGSFTPAAAWAAWQFVIDGLYFSGTPDEIRAASADELTERQALRDAQAAGERDWHQFLEHARLKERAPGDERYIKEIEQLALGSAARSRALRELGRAETPENAHALLLELGAWDWRVNPYPRRLGMPPAPPDLPIPALPDEPRRDLTHLQAWAIDDEGNDTPDDAISLEGTRIWVHIADVAALILPESALDIEARGRAETLHLPEGHIHLFPPALTAVLGLGVQAVSPALSFGIDLDEQGGIRSVEVTPSWVRVERLSYAAANRQMDTPFMTGLEHWMELHRARRTLAGAVDIDLPEVHVVVNESGDVAIHPIETLRSRRVVEESMILTGEAVAGYAVARGIPLPFSTQEAPENRVPHDTLAGMFAMRRLLRRSQYRVTPAPHGGLGVPLYAQATSPLRRYLDLLVHRQLRAGLSSYERGMQLLGEGELLESIGMVEAVLPGLRRAEGSSEKHWTLVHLLRHPNLRTEAVLVERRGSMGTLLVPDLALETRTAVPASLKLNSRLEVEISGVDLPNLEFYIRIAA